MAFVYREERKLGSSNNQTSKDIGPGSYGVQASPSKRQSVKEPFNQMVDRNGKNMSSQAQLPKDGGPPGGPSQTYIPGPGQYEISQGFDQINKQMTQARHFQGQGIEQAGIQVIKNTCNFQSKGKRFDDRQLRDRAQMPGPGTYSQDLIPLKQDHKVQPFSHKNSGVQLNLRNQGSESKGPRIVNPPSIPSHQTVFGYEENQKGQLIKQSANQVGFSGERHDKVGPGDYDIDHSHNLMKKTVTGVIQWKKPSTEKGASTAKDFNKKVDLPGPGQYNVTSFDGVKPARHPTSVFASKVSRSATGTGTLGRARTSQGQQNNRPTTVMSELAKNQIDVIDDDEEVEPPGPGAYYNPSTMTSFKTGKRPERLQFFGSTVDRFNPAKSTMKNPLNNVGPGSYQVGSGQRKQSRVQTVQPAFTSNEPRFHGQTVDLTPGPGQYQARSIANEISSKVSSKKGVFGSGQIRFTSDANKEALPGPGQYTTSVQKATNVNKSSAIREQIKKSHSMFIQNQKNNQMAAQSYIAQNQQEKRIASKNYQNQIQYDNKTNTIAQNVKKGESNNPILAVLKAKRNLQAEIGFGSKPPRYNAKAKAEVQDRPQDYLGPGYYEQKGGFDQISTMHNISTRILQNKGTSFVPQAKSCQNFLSNAPRFEHQKPEHKQKKQTIPGPGHYGQAPGDEGSYNPWFKRSYNMLYTEQ